MIKKRRTALDIPRVIATILIVLLHYHQFTGQIGVFFKGAFTFGFMVEFFFLLSGYLSFEKIKTINDGISFSEYLKQKAIRLFPMTMLSVALEVSGVLAHWLLCNDTKFGVVDLGSAVSVKYILLNLFGLSCWVDHESCAFVSWYVGVLIWCNILLYAIIYLSKRLKLSAYVFYFSMILIGLITSESSISLPIFNGWTCRGYMAFYFGLIISPIIKKISKNLKIMHAFIVAIILIGFAICYSFYPDETIVFKDTRFLLIFFYYPLVILLFEIPIISNILDNKILGIIGESTFDMYLLHLPMIVWMHDFIYIFRLQIDYSSLYFTIIFLLSVFIVGLCSCYLIEKPITKYLKRKLSYDS